jgi:hypothetical protein
MYQAIPLLSYIVAIEKDSTLVCLALHEMQASKATYALVDMSSFSFVTSVNRPCRSSLDASFRFTSALRASKRLSLNPFQSKSSFSAASSRSSIREDAETDEEFDARRAVLEGPAWARLLIGGVTLARLHGTSYIYRAHDCIIDISYRCFVLSWQIGTR